MTTEITETLMSLWRDMSLALDVLEARLRQFQTMGNFKFEKQKRKLLKAEKTKKTKLRNQYGSGYIKENGEGTLRFG
jgi:hypothetical protein